MLEDDERRNFPARTGAWPQVRAFVEARCNALGLPRGAALRLELIAEELFVNVAEHGQRGDGKPVRVAVLDAGDDVELCIEDQAPQFNPFVGVEAPSRSTDPGQRPVGGLGRALVLGLSSRRSHQWAEGGNRVTVAVSKAAGTAGGG